MRQKKVCGANNLVCGNYDDQGNLTGGCGYRFQKDDPKGPKAKCPNCKKLRKCNSPVLMANGKCRAHGGASLQGIAHPRFVTGRYADVLSKPLFQLYELAATDADLTSHREDVLLLQTRLLQLLKNGESIALYDRLSDVWDDFESYSRSNNEDGMKKALAELNQLIRKGKAESGRWGEIYQLLRDLERGRANERKRLDDLQQMIPVERATVMISAMAEAVRRRVTDSATLSAITAEFRRILGGKVDSGD